MRKQNINRDIDSANIDENLAAEVATTARKKLAVKHKMTMKQQMKHLAR